jgi:ABC-type cobalamin/Fe3+-siderophores transport system ATPase subunit
MIDINRLSIAFGKREILNIASLQLNDRQAVALIGPNGSGKTTLIKCLTGIQALNAADAVSLSGKALAQYSNKARAGLIGYIPQSFTPCWNQTVEELMRLACGRTSVSASAEREVYRRFELTSLVSNHWQTLSGGERARVLAAMAFVGEPSLLVADEPGAALDIKHRLRLIETLVEYGERHLTVVCLHELDLVFRYFKKVILLCEGRVVFYGDADELVNHPLLDETFGVNFRRFEQNGRYMLYPELS